MRYLFKVNRIQDYDIILLKKDVLNANIPLKDIHIGNGAIVLDCTVQLSPVEKNALLNLLNSHSPLKFTWAENGQDFSEKVRCAEDVDRITAQRIRRAVGGDNPIDEQLKLLRQAWWAHDVTAHPADYNAADKASAAALRGYMQNIHNNIEVIKAEGKAFKTGKGW